MAKPKTIGSEELHTAIQRLADAISRRHPRPEKILLLGIANGGVELARRLVAGLSSRSSTSRAQAGTLDISFHRDDIERNPIPKEFAPTHIPSDVHGATVILVDDVLYTGRTIRAALDALIDFGRPKQIQLAVLVDRGHRELPIRADYVGKNVPTSLGETVEVRLVETDGKDEVVICEKRAK